MLWLDAMKKVYGLRDKKWRSMWEGEEARPDIENSTVAGQDSTQKKATEIIMRAVDEIMNAMALQPGLPSERYKKAGRRLDTTSAAAKRELRCKYH
jgi:hypothetical protein